MFSIGNKIIITDSSLKKNKIGPKVGSCGYIKNIYSNLINTETYFIAAARIIFYQFGNETKHRVESKIIPFLFPKQMKNMNDFNTTEQRYFLRRLNKNNKIKQILKNFYGVKTIATLSPIFTNISEKNIGYKERVAYLTSLWTNNNIGTSIIDVQETPWYYRYKVKGIKNVVIILHAGLTDYKFKNAYIEELSKKEIGEYVEFIKIIKMLNLRYNNQLNLKYIYNIDNTYKVQTTYEQIHTSLYLNLFNGYYNTLCKTYLNTQDSREQQDIKNLIHNLNYVKYRMIHIGQKYNSIT